jgi:hypothetical protein
MLVAYAEPVEETFPETERQGVAGLAEGLFRDEFVRRSKHRPGLDEGLGHRFAVETGVHDQPGHDFRDQATPAFGEASGLVGDGLELFGREDAAEGIEPGVLDEGYSVNACRTDTGHEKASMQAPDEWRSFVATVIAFHSSTCRGFFF